MRENSIDSPGPVLLTVDLEDWQQLVGRRVGAPGWDEAHEAFRRQAEETLALLRDADVRATFFVLGMTARHHPDVVERVAAAGHEIACHGFSHTRVWEQERGEFRRDVEECLALVEGIGARAPIGYRAPAFSLTARTTWAFDVLAELGLRYDSSQYDSAKIRDRLPGAKEPYRVELASGTDLWELPIAVASLAGRRLPIGGGSYWRVLPARAVLDGVDRLARERRFPVLYVHPYELGSRALRVGLPPGAPARQRAAATWYAVRYNPGRGRIAALLAEAAERFRLTTCEEALPDVERCHGTSSRALPRQGAGV